ncbi:MAG: tRNA-dihydrouridine synthase family protein [Bacteroidales bacterium]|nr:tRNA-dihydrouridine synthase family protein [Candidatus Scybalocola fimicaballi]
MEIHFAPLQGYTDSVFRKLHAEIFGGVDKYYTPFIRVERGDFRKKDLRELPDATECCTIPQIIASTKPDDVEKMVAMLEEKGYKEVNINMGCPFPMIAKHGMGSGLLADKDAVKAMIEVLKAHPSIQFSLKTRLGYDDENQIFDMMDIINEFPFTEVTMHPRIAKDQYSGEINHAKFAEFAKVCKHPLIYNGDVTTTDDINKISSLYPTLKGIMIGRGLLMNPALASEFKNGEMMPDKEKRDKSKQLIKKLFAHCEELMNGEEQSVAHVKAYFEYLLPEIEKRNRKKVLKANKAEKLRAAIAEFFI